MLQVTLKISDVNLSEGVFILWVGNYGHPIRIDTLKEFASNADFRNISQETLYRICAVKIWELSKQLGVSIKDLSLLQLRSAIETTMEI